MAREYLKKATLTSESDASQTHDIVQGILADIEAGGAKSSEVLVFGQSVVLRLIRPRLHYTGPEPTS